MNLKEILSQFFWATSADFFSHIDVRPLGSGHIHQTYLLDFTTNEDPISGQFVVQKINHNVFANVQGMMHNMSMVTRHLSEKYRAPHDYDRDWETLQIVQTKSGNNFFEDSDANFWRCFEFVPSSKSYDLVTRKEQAYEGGLALGRFQADLLDFEPSQLIEVLPGFHDVDNRYKQFEESLKNDRVGRRTEVSQEIEGLVSRYTQMRKIKQWGEEGSLPLRVTHNDSKFNNILLNHEDLAIAVIDLDTVMPGFVAFDFGDAIRTIINTAAEDEVDLSKIMLQKQFFEEFTKGYLSQVKEILTPFELESLWEGVVLLPYLQSMRFLTDYLNGDIYFKINHAQHNLQRSRAQLQLLTLLENESLGLQEIIQRNL